jgi:hypothetical protein
MFPFAHLSEALTTPPLISTNGRIGLLFRKVNLGPNKNVISLPLTVPLLRALIFVPNTLQKPRSAAKPTALVTFAAIVPPAPAQLMPFGPPAKGVLWMYIKPGDVSTLGKFWAAAMPAARKSNPAHTNGVRTFNLAM